MNILGLEVSTSSAKTIIYSADNGVVDVQSIPYPSEVCDVVSQDIEGMYGTLIECTKKILKDNDLNIDAIGISTTWHSLLLLDSDKRPIGRLRTWADTEASHTSKRYREDTT